MMMIELPPPHVSRLFILPIPTFDYLKRYQRAVAARTGQKLDNSQVITQLLAEHEQFIGLTGKPSAAPKAALLMPPKVSAKEGQE
ncbi:hypothetical protein [Oryzomicrobium sp.]|uniref:hypothetical protein n=1 Tax=Oryzomicrobium sp. TaxID=1911578 RepID=UPI0025DE4684|nr:hypothetical protein [Oryzomicrobium sp.]MCE1243794.1 hypothetical protein [Oryzomicrobium sp.]